MMRLSLSALVVAAGIAGFGAAAQAAPVSSAGTVGAPSSHIQRVDMERRTMRRHMERKMMRHEMRRRMMRREMRRM